MSYSKAVFSTACTCECEHGFVYKCQENSEADGQDLDWQRCDCTFCGPALEDGSRKCLVQISPMLVLQTATQSCASTTGTLPVFCGSCRGHCLFKRRRDAVIRGRAVRKQQRLNTKTKTLDSVHRLAKTHIVELNNWTGVCKIKRMNGRHSRILALSHKSLSRREMKCRKKLLAITI